MERHWTDDRNPDDAPPWFLAEAAGYWADGWNAAVRAFREEAERADSDR